MLEAIVVSLVLTVLFGIPTLPLLRKMQAIQKISEFAPEAHQAKQGTPTMGGLMMIAAALVVFVLYNEAVLGTSATTGYPAYVPLAMWLVLGFGAIGFLDDYVIPRRSSKRGLGWIPKLVMQFGVAVPVCWYAMWNWLPTLPPHSDHFMTGTYFPPLGGILGAVSGVLVSSVIIVGLANAFNFTDGLDGLGAGTMTLAALGLALTSAPFAPVVLTSTLIGVCLGFLFYNAPPAKVFMGDTGSLPIGALFAWALLNTAHVSWWALLLCGVFLVELIPVPIQIASVKLFKRRVFYRTPIHHAFEAKGFRETRVTAGFILAQAVLTFAYVALVRR
jgi:phospho-N-acetylmuramoyl-pentapeptide-transferase